MRDKKLIPGETVIGSQWIVTSNEPNTPPKEYTVYYGNVISPLIDGNVPHLHEKKYLKILNDFLDSDEGSEYIRPSVEEIKNAERFLIKKEENIKNKRMIENKKEEKERLDQHEQQLDIERLKERQEIEEMRQRNLDNEEITGMYSSQHESTQTNESSSLLQQQVIISDLEERLSRLRILPIILGVLLLLSLILNGLLFLNGNQLTQQKYTEITIDDTSYQIPVSIVPDDNDGTVITIYGFTTSKENGSVVTKAIPMGDLIIEKSKK